MRMQEIKYDAQGDAYVRHYGKKLSLNNFVLTKNNPWGASGPETVTKNGKEIRIDGWYAIGYWGAYGIHISDCGDAAGVVYKQNF